MEPEAAPGVAPEAAPAGELPAEPGWWRRNALALGLAVVLLVATVGITSWKEWSDYFGTRPVQPISVDVGDEVEYAGATWQLVNVLAGNSDEVAQIPEGTTMLLARVQVTPDPDSDTAPGCMVRLSGRGGTAGDREWSSAAYRSIGYQTSDGFESYCLPDAVAPYQLEVPFIIPTGSADETGALSLVIEVADQLPQYLRLALPAG